MNIKFVIFDFDNNSNVKKCYNAKDSYALKILKKKI